MAKSKSKSAADVDDLLTIPTFLDRRIADGKMAVGYKTVDGKLYKVDEEGNLFDANTNKLKRDKK
jgi:hypothetical protein